MYFFGSWRERDRLAATPCAQKKVVLCLVVRICLTGISDHYRLSVGKPRVADSPEIQTAVTTSEPRVVL